MKFLIVATLLILTSLVHAENGEVAVIQIMSRPAAAMIESVRPLLGGNGSVSAFHDKLIVKGNKRQIAAVRSMLREIDHPARRLIIEVRQGGSLSLSSQGFGYGVNTENVRIGRVPPGSEAQISYGNIQTRGRDDSLQRVQALDGRPALIRAGQSVPIYQAQQYIGRHGFAQGYQVRYRDTSSGFHALPRVHGDQVTIEIYQQHERPLANGRFNIQQASTVLRGRLGQWLTLGSIGGQDNDDRDQLGMHVQTQRAQDRRLELRVIPVD